MTTSESDRAQKIATLIAGAALRHDFGGPLGNIGRAMDFIHRKVHTLDETSKNSRLKAFVESARSRVELTEKNLQPAFRSFGQAIGQLGAFQREQEYRKVQQLASPSIEELLTVSKAIQREVAQLNMAKLDKLASSMVTSSRRLNGMLTGLGFFIRIQDISRDSFIESDLRRVVETRIFSIRSGALLDHRRETYVPVNGHASAAIIPVHFDQLIQNLVSNALKFASLADEPNVSVSISEAPFIQLRSKYEQEIGSIDGNGKWAEVIVEDNGPGVSTKIKESLFKLYEHQQHESIPESSSGVGLAIVALVVAIHGGWVHFERTDGMTRFVVLLPAQQKDRLNVAWSILN